MAALGDLVLVLLCYIYIVSVVLVSQTLYRRAPVLRRVSRKFLHVLIGNLPFVIPFFASELAPIAVAAPFILVTYLASPYSPASRVRTRLRGLAAITEEGHPLGLVLYAVSYTVLAALFGSDPSVVAAGILPMAYGDSVASLVGAKYGRLRYRLFATKSVAGSLAMFIASAVSLVVGLFVVAALQASLFSTPQVLAGLAAAAVAALVEGCSPASFDNLTVPLVSAGTFFLLGGGR